jgi:protein phosphatase
VGDELMQLTKDHSLVQRLVDDGYITEEDAERHPNRNVIMRALGDKDQLVVDYNYLFLKENESWKFLMCSDGVSGVLTKEEIKTFLSKDNLQAISKNISDEIEMRGAPDNFSFVIISNKI